MNDIHAAIIERLSEYIDGELDPRAHAEIEQHVRSCPDCRTALAELEAVAARAAALVDASPDRDLWSGIDARIGGRPGAAAFDRRPRRRFSFTLPQLAAASLALMVVSGGLVWLARSGDPRADFPSTSASTDIPDVTAASLTETHYEGAVEDLERTLERGRAELDPETVRVLEQNLQSIDAAIEQCRRALEKDPANAFLNSRLADARQKKLALLRRATALTAGS